jgi:predicted outer membrane repeat protein
MTNRRVTGGTPAPWVRALIASVAVLVLAHGRVGAVDAATLRVGPAPWGDYATIQAAVDAAAAGDELWVREGTYALSSEIVVDESIAIYGGFAGGETTRDERDWNAHPTIIDGQHGSRCLRITADARIDGFTIRRGQDAAEYSNGGGIYVAGAAPVIANCLIADNSASWRGGGVFNDGASPTIDKCTFSGNQSGGGGGAMANAGSSAPVISNSSFDENEALYTGGAIYDDYGSSPIIQKCHFTRNRTRHDDMGSADSSGGAVFIGSHSSALIEDCTFTENSVKVYGGAIYSNNWGASQPTIIRRCEFVRNSTPFVGGGLFVVHAEGSVSNCVFLENSASWGGAMSVFNTSGWSVINTSYLDNSAGGGASLDISDSDMVLTNSIVWGAGSHVASQYSTLAVSYSDLQGSGGSAAWNPAYGSDGGGNIDADPLFVSDSDLHLSVGSPCIDQGNPDPSYNDRDETRNDMGAYGGSEAEVRIPTVSIGPASTTEGQPGTSGVQTFPSREE